MKPSGLAGMSAANAPSPLDGEDRHIEDMASGSSNILVSVRVRPEHPHETTCALYRNIVRVLDRNVIVFDPNPSSMLDDDVENNDPLAASSSNTSNRINGVVRRHKDQKYAFDRVFDETASQLEVYEGTTKFLIEGVLNGYNATVFAYGATGAGKTYTMMGCDSSGPGVMVLTMIDLFKAIEASKADKLVKVSMSYLEVYNEQIRDLLAPTASSNLKNLELREDKEKGMRVASLTEICPKDADEVLRLLEEGNRNRTQHGTEANATSSRSHAVLQIMVEQRERGSDVRTDVRYAKLSLIDLAGSERAAVTKNRGIRLTEGANINKSLLALGNCINALAEGKAGAYVPYRNSKLTRLLKDSLGGNCRTVMIAAVSPASMSFEDTHNTLKYSNRAKNIKMKVERNVLNVNFHIASYTRLISDLRNQVAELKIELAKRDAAAATAGSGAGFHGGRGRDAMNAAHLAAFGAANGLPAVPTEIAAVASFRARIADAFQERMRVKRSMVELDERERHEQAVHNAKWDEVDTYFRTHTQAPDEELPVRIAILQRDLEEQSEKVRQYSDLRTSLTARMARAEKAWKLLWEDLPKCISGADARLSLNECLQLREAEVYNMELACQIERQKRAMEALQAQLADSVPVPESPSVGLAPQGRRRDSYSDFLITPLRPQNRKARVMTPTMTASSLSKNVNMVPILQLPPAFSNAGAVINDENSPVACKGGLGNDGAAPFKQQQQQQQQQQPAFLERRKQFKQQKQQQAWQTPRGEVATEEHGSNAPSMPSSARGAPSSVLLDRLSRPTLSSQQKKNMNGPAGPGAGAGLSSALVSGPAATTTATAAAAGNGTVANSMKKSVKFSDAPLQSIVSGALIDRPGTAPPTISVSLTGLNLHSSVASSTLGSCYNNSSQCGTASLALKLSQIVGKPQRSQANAAALVAPATAR